MAMTKAIIVKDGHGWKWRLLDMFGTLIAKGRCLRQGDCKDQMRSEREEHVRKARATHDHLKAYTGKSTWKYQKYPTRSA